MTELARKIQLAMDFMDVTSENKSLTKEEQIKKGIEPFIDLIQSHTKEQILDALWSLQEEA